MENKELAEKWPGIQNKLLANHPTLTREELVLEIGKEGELLEHLQQKLKMNKQEIDSMLSFMG